MLLTLPTYYYMLRSIINMLWVLYSLTRNQNIFLKIWERFNSYYLDTYWSNSTPAWIRELFKYENTYNRMWRFYLTGHETLCSPCILFIYYHWGEATLECSLSPFSHRSVIIGSVVHSGWKQKQHQNIQCFCYFFGIKSVPYFS